jgi:ribosomal-protein-alanine N-acetyltransferase
MHTRQIPIIRPLRETDLPAVLAIEEASFPNPWRPEHFQHEMTSPYSFPLIAECEGAVVGYVCLMALFEEAQILDIAVAPDQRGKGVARLLMDQAISMAREKEAEVLALEVRVSSSAAISLYERCGFIRTGLRSRYYEGRDDAVLMELNLIVKEV